MNKRLMSVALIAATIMTATAKNDDPVLMTINGKKVPLSEFEYLYNKNNSQQVQQQSIDEYVDMFVTYKLKVAEAEAAGIDTTQAFIKEFNGYRNELARPYLSNDAITDSLVANAYSHMAEDVDVSHIMLQLGMNPSEADSLKNALNNIRTEIINGASFEEMALKHSIDGYAKHNQGRMGFISAGKYPYTFEDAAYDTPVGEISHVIETPFGYHIVKVHGRRPASGKVLTRHILKLTRGLSPEAAAVKKTQIDSIYSLVNNGADFSEIAKRESEDPGSARQGGMLRWFGTGEMVKEFEQTAFALNNGEISKPFATSYGYHIIQKLDSKGIPTFEEAKDEILNKINEDERGTLGQKLKIEELKKTYNAKLIEPAFNKIKGFLIECNGYDSTFITNHKNSNLVVAKTGNINITFADILKAMPRTAKLTPDGAVQLLRVKTDELLTAKTVEYEISLLPTKHEDFRNLINEYRDGMLLFEISNRNVWEKASKDKEGLEKFFQANKYKYTWDGPKYKGFVIFTTSDSVMNEVNNFLATNKLENDSVTKVLRKQFGRNIKVEKVIAAKGENEVIDNIAFYGPQPEMKGKWTKFIGYNGKIISWPEEAADVRGPVTSDYQAELEKAWVKSLHEKYPVKINPKVLKKVKDK